MLSSTDNPLPDLSQISQKLINSSSSNIANGDDDNDDHNVQNQLKVTDLLDSSLDEDIPVPKFCIRDYVFGLRDKDIKTNWPFSHENLQLCMKHGVKDVLPPFQSLDSVRNPCVVKTVVENTSTSDAKLSQSSDHLLSVASGDVCEQLAVNIENNNSSGSRQDKELPSATTSQSCSDVNSALAVKSTYLEAEAENLGESSKQKLESTLQESSKVENNIQNPIKKCRLIVKLNNAAEPRSNDNLTSNTETMASKVCPVCKTFSSSSNTTLNAHIDQCLSVESTNKSTTDSKVIKHRIKPRKIKLMVDIYKTAASCTLEDLDRRNGTNWASNLGGPAQDSEVCAKEKIEKKKAFPSVNTEDDEEGAVYIDSNGTKVRILSKFSIPSSSTVSKDDHCPRKVVKKDKGSKSLSTKKKYFVDKHTHLQCPLGRRSSLSRADHSPVIDNGQPRELPIEEGYKEDPARPPMTYDQMTSDDLGMIKQWVGSKRTGLRKKMSLRHGNHHLGKSTKNLREKSNLSSSCDERYITRTSYSNSPVVRDKMSLLRKTKENLSCNTHAERDLRKRAEFSSLESQDLHGDRIHLEFSNNFKRLRKDGSAIHERFEDPPNGTKNQVSFQRCKKMGTNISPSATANGSFISSRMPGHHAFSSRGKEYASVETDHAMLSGGNKFSLSKHNLLPDRHASSLKSKKLLGRKRLDSTKPMSCYVSRLDDDAAVSRIVIQKQDNLVETRSKSLAHMGTGLGEASANQARSMKFRKRRRRFISEVKSSDTSESESHGVGENIGRLVGVNVPAGISNVIEATKDVEIENELVYETTSGVANGEAFTTFRKSLGSAFTVAVNPSDEEHDSEQYLKAYEENYAPERVMGGNQEFFPEGKLDKYLVTTETDDVTEMNANEVKDNYFVDVDPIPIPGPPGSFLPSPGRMGSEELQGNSSLTTCRLQSSEDKHEMVDMDSPDSPISSMSNFDAGRSASVSITKLSKESHGSLHETLCDISNDRRIDPVVKSLPKLDNHRFQNGQICCSTKEGSLPNVPLDQEVPDEKNAANSPMGSAPGLVSHDSKSNYSVSGDCELPSPSTPNPVLRLMGKNLMVMNKDENLSPQSRPTQSSMENFHPGPCSCIGNRVPTGYEHPSFHNVLSRGPPMFHNMQNGMPAQNFAFSSINSSERPSNSMTQQFSSHQPTVALSSRNYNGNFTSSLDRQEYGGGCNSNAGQFRSNIEKLRPPVPQLIPASFSGSKRNEIIIIDDSPKGEAGPFNNVNVEAGASSFGIPGSVALGNDLPHVNPFYGYPTRGYPLCNGSRMVQSANAHVPYPKENANFVQWSHTPGSSSVLQPSPLMGPSPPTGHQRSALYFSPGFS